MKKLLIALVLLCAPLLAGAVDLKGGRIVAKDGQFLGTVGDRFQNESILNQFGVYGDRHNAVSLWNPFGKYGDQFNDLSAFNPHATAPPKITLPNHGGWYYLTVNPFFTPRIDPNTLKPAE